MFNIKTWKNRLSEFPNRRTIANNDLGTSFTATVTRNEGTVSETGDAFSAENMNDLENRIASSINSIEQNMAKVMTSATATEFIAKGDYFIYEGNEMIDLQNELSRQQNAKDVGKQFDVLVEGRSKRSADQLFGRTGQNKVVVFDREDYRVGQILRAEILDSTSATLMGRIVKDC